MSGRRGGRRGRGRCDEDEDACQRQVESCDRDDSYGHLVSQDRDQGLGARLQAETRSRAHRAGHQAAPSHWSVSHPLPPSLPHHHHHHQPTSTDSTRNSQRRLSQPPLFPIPGPRKPPPLSHPSTPSPPSATTPPPVGHLPTSNPPRPHPLPFPEPANVSEASPSLPLPTKESVPGSVPKYSPFRPTRRPAVKTMTTPNHTLYHFSLIPL